MPGRTLIATVVVTLVLGTSGVDAQYFGRNKVQYERFDFRVLQTEHFDIHYYPEEEAAVRLAARMAERWYVRLAALFEHQLSGRQPLVLYAAHPHFQQTTTLDGEISEGTGGVTEGAKRRVILPFAGGLAETDHVLGHELVHAFQYDIAAQTDLQGRPIGPALQALPLWFVEGMAEYLSLGPVDANTAMWIREATRREAMPSVDRLDDPDFFPYRYGHAFWAYVAGRWGDRAVPEMLDATGPEGDIDRAIGAVLGLDRDTLTRDWHAATARDYAAAIAGAARPETFARPLVTREGGGEMNLAPALSPDGQRLLMLSERSLFSIDLFVVDARTGEVLRRLVDFAGDPHFESLQFLRSAGDWAPDNRRVVIAALRAGQPVLAILNADTGAREREVAFPDLGEIYNPAWSPDGRRIAFSALRGGVLDLFVHDLESGTTRPLTDDPFADLDPEWSPDGRELVWVTDRFGTDLATLSFGNYELAAMAADGGSPRRLPAFPVGRHTNPEFDPDGTLYFIATPDGIPNVYRLRAGATGVPERLTTVVGGVSGITPLTPALTAAARTSAVVFSVFEEDAYQLYATDGSAEALGPTSIRGADVLPPMDRRVDTVVQALAAPAAGLPPAISSPGLPYRAKLSLDSVIQPSIGVGVDRFGAFGGGGVAFLFSDVLGYHTLGATVQVTNRIQDTAGAVTYLNRRRRWNWGVVVEHVPYTSGSVSQSTGTVGTRNAVLQETFRVVQLNQAATGLLQYPFSRVRRLELSGGLRRVSYDARLEQLLFDAVTGDLIGDERRDISTPSALNLGQLGAALVYDSSTFGATSPVLGQRYRLEWSQMAGSVQYTGLLADYRRYVMPVRPFTIAFRGVHFGRYGAGAEDERLPYLNLGYPGLVRGYDSGSFNPDECQQVDVTRCDGFGRLTGSRIAVGSVELRFPLLGVFSRRSFYGPFPLELAVFGDAGVAWTTDARPSWAGGTRDGIRSAGVALRANLFGYAVAEVDFVRPFDRGQTGWVWTFGLMPGF